MSKRYSEFRLELIEDQTTLAEAERHAQKLKAEIKKETEKSQTRNLRLTYALDELQATEDHIRDIKRQMAMEEAEAR